MGHTKALMRKRNPKAPQACRGRNSFSRTVRGGCNRARCGLCKPGRHHRAGGAKAEKKACPGSSQGCKWRAIKEEARNAEKKYISAEKQFERRPFVGRLGTKAAKPGAEEEEILCGESVSALRIFGACQFGCACFVRKTMQQKEVLLPVQQK